MTSTDCLDPADIVLVRFLTVLVSVLKKESLSGRDIHHTRSMDIEEQLLANSIRDTINEADQAVNQISYLMYGNTEDNVEEGPHAEALDEAQRTVRFFVDKVIRDTCLLAERLGAPMFRHEVAEIRTEYPDLADVALDPEDIHFRCRPLDVARQMFNSLSALTNGRSLTGLGIFETVLQNTPRIIAAASLRPENESQVSARVREVLGFAFDHVVSNVPIPKSIKTYKPDIAIAPLMAAAEYKFVDSKTEAKKVLDEIYADMRGYGGNPEWRSFYAVLYQTSPFYTQREVDHEFRLVKADISWTPYVMVGPGERKTKTSKM